MKWTLKINKSFQCYLSTLVVAELYKGVYCSQRIQQNLNHLAELTMLLPIEAFDLRVAEEFGKIQAELRQIARPTGEVDALIAAVARSRQDVLVKNNPRHFENIPNLSSVLAAEKKSLVEKPLSKFESCYMERRKINLEQNHLATDQFAQFLALDTELLIERGLT
jgi:tRNA(fMet)-specific endonuclease VapC